MMDNIKELRTRLGLTQREFARELGVTSNSVQNWENERSKPTYRMLEHICATFDVDRRWLLGTTANTISYEYGEEVVLMDKAIAAKVGSSERVKIIQIKEDSMSPKYENGDLIFVDCAERDFAAEGIYAIKYMNTLMVRYLQRTHNDVRIRSLNRAVYDDIDIAGINEIEIIGRVTGGITFA